MLKVPVVNKKLCGRRADFFGELRGTCKRGLTAARAERFEVSPIDAYRTRGEPPRAQALGDRLPHQPHHLAGAPLVFYVEGAGDTVAHPFDLVVDVVL